MHVGGARVNIRRAAAASGDMLSRELHLANGPWYRPLFAPRRLSAENRASILRVKELNRNRFLDEDGAALGTLVNSLCPQRQKTKGARIVCHPSHTACLAYGGKQHGVLLRDMRLDHLKAALDCAGVSGWEAREAQWLAERRSNGKTASRKFFRKLTLSPNLLGEHQMLAVSSNLAEAIETAAKLVVLPTLKHLVSAEKRAILSRVYELTGYTEGNCNADRNEAQIRLAVKMSRRWEPQLQPNPVGEDGKPKAWMPRGPSWLFTSDLIFGDDWKNWKWQICNGGALSSRGTGSEQATGMRLAQAGCALAMYVAGVGYLPWPVKVISVNSVSLTGDGKVVSCTATIILLRPQIVEELQTSVITFPAEGLCVGLWHMMRGRVQSFRWSARRRASMAADRCLEKRKIIYFALWAGLTFLWKM